MNIKDSIIDRMTINSTKAKDVQIKQQRRRNRHKFILNDFCILFEATGNSFKSKTEMLSILKCRRKLFLATFKNMFNNGYFDIESPKQTGIKGKPKKYALSEYYFQTIKNKNKPKIVWNF